MIRVVIVRQVMSGWYRRVLISGLQQLGITRGVIHRQCSLFAGCDLCPASAESTQMEPLDPTIQQIDPSSLDVD